LASIDANLTRIADALELLVVSLGPARRREWGVNDVTCIVAFL
jgi:hypothetical protein